MDSLAFLSAMEQPLELDIKYLANRMLGFDIYNSRQVLAYVGV